MSVLRFFKKMGHVSRKVCKRPLLTKLQQKKRKRFADKFARWTVDQWRKVIFSDEKIFRVRPGSLIKCWRQKTSSRYAARYVNQTIQKPQGLMIWSAMNGRGEIIIRRCPPKVKAVDYQNILRTAKKFIKPRYVFIFHE
jgi:hypothetical protein